MPIGTVRLAHVARLSDLDTQAVNDDHSQMVQEIIDSHRKALGNLQVR
jgi:hypothetical protein